jgi:hypothetical protein
MRIRCPAREAADRGGGQRAELVIAHRPARDADQGEAFGQQAVVGEVGKRRE